jgi:hypothetical protein
MDKQIILTDFQGGIAVLSKEHHSGAIGITIAKNLDEMVDNNSNYFELDVDDLDEFINILKDLKADINFSQPFKVDTK